MTEKNKIISSLLYKFLERIGYQGVSFIIGIILARVLGPEVYGTIAILLVFITFAQVFVQSGLNYALIQKKEVNEESFSTVFYISMIVVVILYLVLFFTSPFIAKLYKDESLCLFLRVLSLVLFPAAYNSIQNAIIVRDLQFKYQLVSNLIAIVSSGLLSILLAYFGLGVWVLVIQQIAIQVFSCFAMMIFVKWRPKFCFNKNEALRLGRYGSKLLASQLFVTFYEECTTLVIGRYYPQEIVGYYNRGAQFPKLIAVNINSAIQSVIFPVLSKEQEQHHVIQKIVLRAIDYSTYIITPLLAGLAVVAPSLVTILLGSEWAGCVPYLQLMCLFYIVQPIGTEYIQAIMAIGRTGVSMILGIIKSLFGFSAILIASIVSIDVLSIVIAIVINQFLYTISCGVVFAILFHCSLRDHCLVIIKNLLLSIAMYYCLNLLSLMIIQPFSLLCLQVFAGIILYFLFSRVLKPSPFMEVLAFLRRRGASRYEK